MNGLCALCTLLCTREFDYTMADSSSIASQDQRGFAHGAEPAPFSYTPPGRNHLFVPGQRVEKMCCLDLVGHWVRIRCSWPRSCLAPAGTRRGTGG